FITLGPRVLINAADLTATGLVQQGSRIAYRLLVAGDAAVVEEFREWAQARLTLGERIEGIRDARPEIKAALERAEKFLSLAALASVVLAAAAIALAVRRFSQRHLDGCAVMRCLGASQAGILRLYLYHFIMLGAIASMAGCLLGLAAQEALVYWLSALVEAELPWPSLLPAAHGLLTGMVLLLGFALPPLLNLRRVPALRVLRRDIGMPTTYSLTGYALGLAALSGLFLWKAGDVRLGGFVAAIAIFGSLGFLLVKAMAGGRGQTGGAWRYGLASIQRRATASVVQAVALGLGLMALLALTLIRDDLLQNWRTSLPPDAPNRFLVNIQEDQLQPLEAFFSQHDIVHPPVFPMVRGRLTAINDQMIAADSYADTRAKRLVEREFNLSWASEMSSDNQIVKGHWWKSGDTGKAVLSVEEGIAKTVGIRVGDSLTYDVAGSAFSATVT
ncbi:MAG: FtsX-like permease family protein, partial [Pseudomonadota bacterium]